MKKYTVIAHEWVNGKLKTHHHHFNTLNECMREIRHHSNYYSVKVYSPDDELVYSSNTNPDGTYA
jgi:hypothetical protein